MNKFFSFSKIYFFISVFITVCFLSPLSCRVDAAPKVDSKRSQKIEVPFSGPAVMAIVSIDHQTVSLFDEQGGSLKSPISSGQFDYETPVGIYSVLQKEEEHYSNVYDDAAMPFMQRITWSGISLHAGELPGYPASHGCVRLPHSFAQKIFGQTRLGMRVIVARDKISPRPLTHPALFQPLLQTPKSDIQDFSSLKSQSVGEGYLNEKNLQLLPDVRRWPARSAQLAYLNKEAFLLDRKAKELASELELPKRTLDELTKSRDDIKKKLQGLELKRKTADKELIRAVQQFQRTRKPAEMTMASNARLAILEKQANLDVEISTVQLELGKANELLKGASDVFKELEAQYQEAFRNANEAKLKMLPISVLVSLKTQRIYVRQGFEQIMEGELEIESPNEPIGTHIYTALGYDESGDHVRWTSVSLRSPERTFAYISNSYDEDYQWISDNPNRVSDYEDASSALERIVIPSSMRKRISEYVWPGSSLIITDEEPHKETGQATEFIVLMSGEPQGGIIKRGPSVPPGDYYWDSFFNLSDEDDRRRYERARRRFEREMRRLEKRRQRIYYGWD